MKQRVTALWLLLTILDKGGLVLICFPLDNVEYEANALGAWCGTRTRGVFSADGHYSVRANGGMSVLVSPGLAWLKADIFWGVIAYEVDPKVLQVDRADGSLSRIDAVCIRLDKNQNVGKLFIKKGVYTPQPPTIVLPIRNLDYDEIYVATILVRAGATSILSSDITDQRMNENYCGIMRDGVTGIPTQSLYESWESWFDNIRSDTNAAFDAYKQMALEIYQQHEQKIIEYTQNAVTAYDAYIDRMTKYETTAKSDFENWFDSIKEILDENMAGNIQNQIEILKDRIPSVNIADVVLSQSIELYPMCALYESEWAFGVGGAGLGPAGGGAVSKVEMDYIFNEYSLKIIAPEKFKDCTTVQKISDNLYSFFKDDKNDKQCLLLVISD